MKIYPRVKAVELAGCDWVHVDITDGTISLEQFSYHFYTRVLLSHAYSQFSRISKHINQRWSALYNLPKQHLRSLGLRDFRIIVQSDAPFARKFFGAWQDRQRISGSQHKQCYSRWLVCEKIEYFLRNREWLIKRLEQLISRRLTRKNFRVGQCKWWNHFSVRVAC